jgi:hypothetical protein
MGHLACLSWTARLTVLRQETLYLREPGQPQEMVESTISVVRSTDVSEALHQGGCHAPRGGA